MDIKRQERAPIYEALEEFKKKRVVPLQRHPPQAPPPL